MTTQAEARNALMVAFGEGFRDLRGARDIPYAWDNETKETSGRSISVEVSIRNTASEQRTLGKPGNRRYRREGVLNVKITTRPGEQMQETIELAQGIRRIFEGKQIKGVNPIGGVLVQEEGREIAGFITMVTFPFWYEERG